MKPSAVVAVLCTTLAGTGCGGGAEESAPAVGGAEAEALPLVEAGRVTVSDILVAEPVAGERTVLYMTLRNRGDSIEVLTGVEAPGLGTASVHRTELEDGTMRMRPAGEVVVGPGETVPFRPGGLHVMLEDLRRDLVAGDTVELVLHFRVEGELALPAVVVPYADVERRLPEAEGANRRPGNAGGR